MTEPHSQLLRLEKQTKRSNEIKHLEYHTQFTIKFFNQLKPCRAFLALA